MFHEQGSIQLLRTKEVCKIILQKCLLRLEPQRPQKLSQEEFQPTGGTEKHVLGLGKKCAHRHTQQNSGYQMGTGSNICNGRKLDFEW